MKKEILRLSNVSFNDKRYKCGPLDLQLFKGKMTGVLVDDFFNKEIIVNLLLGRIPLINGDVFINEKWMSERELAKSAKKNYASQIGIVSEQTRLFHSLNIVENVFFPKFLIKTSKQNKIVRELFQHFQYDFSLNKRINQLSTLERIEIELIHALVCGKKMIIVSDIFKLLREKEIKKLSRTFKYLLDMGITILLIDNLTDTILNMVDYFFLVKGGKTVGAGYRGEYSYMESYFLLNNPGRIEEYQNLLNMKNQKYFADKNEIVYSWQHVSAGRIKDVSFSVKKGEIIEIVCQKHSNYTALKKQMCDNGIPEKGEIYFNNQKITESLRYKGLLKWDIGHIDLGREFLFKNKTILENICYPLCQKKSFFYLGTKYMRAVKDMVEEVLPELDIKQEISALSLEQTIWTGIMKWVVCKPLLLMFFVPASMTLESIDLISERLFIKLAMYGVSILIITEQHEIGSNIIDSEIII